MRRLTKYWSCKKKRMARDCQKIQRAKLKRTEKIHHYKLPIRLIHHNQTHNYLLLKMFNLKWTQNYRKNTKFMWIKCLIMDSILWHFLISWTLKKQEWDKILIILHQNSLSSTSMSLFRYKSRFKLRKSSLNLIKLIDQKKQPKYWNLHLLL